ncbi:MAG: hypothetical protein D6734_09325 [Candidatus Schekmanbacteria bacterium]|nr:MAG: hypothetical protein D6734_09325 [Candidatus Schekmanbacteria bacterium]
MNHITDLAFFQSFFLQMCDNALKYSFIHKQSFYILCKFENPYSQSFFYAVFLWITSPNFCRRQICFAKNNVIKDTLSSNKPFNFEKEVENVYERLDI